jgi:GT2 family glycosyltransferase
MIKIQTLSWNGLDKLKFLRASLQPALNDLDYEWLIRDNVSTDGTVEEISTWGDKVKVFPYPHNKDNFAQGMNYLFDKANPKDDDYILLLNNDVIINDTHSIKNMISIMENDSTVGVVGAKLLYTNTNKIQHCGVVFHNHHQTPTHFKIGQEATKIDSQNREFQVVTGAVMLMRAEDFKKVNGFDCNFIWCFDDVDLALKIKYNIGKKIIYCGQTNIYHEESASLKKNPVNKLFMPHNIQYFMKKWRGKYKLDENDYMKNPNLNLYRAPK